MNSIIPQTDSKAKLASRIIKRADADKKWAFLYFRLGHLLLWTAIMSSFGLAVFSSIQQLPPWILALLAAVPGSVILIDRSFAFGRRAMWHARMETLCIALEHKLEFEAGAVDDISREFTQLLMDMTLYYPGLNADSLTEITSPKHIEHHRA